MPVKIGFQIISTTGEDEDFRATELNYHGPTVRGWRSSVNCTFPQEIVLRLRVIAILHQIQILAHQYLIPQKIEICTSNSLEVDTFNCNNPRDLFEYLGFITFSDNEATAFRSRELKSILIPSKIAKYVKLRIHKNHANVKNVHNQVSLIAVNILGDEMVEKGEESEANNNFNQSDVHHSLLTFDPNYFSPYDDLAFEMSVDEETVQIIKVIECKMLQAVFEDRLDYANALSITIENLRAAGEILGVYEQEKRKAINQEDFDKAKAKKFQIDNFRQKIYSTLRIDRLLEETDFAEEYDLNSNPEFPSNGSTPIRNSPRRHQINGRIANPPEIKENHKEYQTSPLKSFRPHQSTHTLHPHISHSRSQTFAASTSLLPPKIPSFSSNPHLYQHLKHTRPTILEDNHEIEPVKTPSSASDSLTAESFPPESPEKQNNYNEPVPTRCDTKSTPMGSWRGSKLKTSLSEQKIRSKGSVAVKSSFEAYEDRMLPALRSYHGNEVVRECQLAFGQQRRSTLNEREKKQAMLPIAVFGIEMIEKFYSKNFNDKEEGLKQLQEELKRTVDGVEGSDGAKSPSYNKLARAAIFLLHRALRDTVYSVYKLAAETVRLFFSEFVPQRVSSSEVAKSVEKLLPELLTKSGDVTPRIHNMAAHTLLSMAECEEVRRLNIIPAHLSRPLTSSIHPRLALSRLEMVEQLILNHGISKDKKSGLTCRTLAEFGSSGLHHPAEAVRKVSERILILVYKVNPRIVRKQLPPDDNVTRRNLLYRQLYQEFDVLDIKRKINQQAIDNSVTNFEPNPSQTQPSQHSKVQQKYKTINNADNKCSTEENVQKQTVNFDLDISLSPNNKKDRIQMEKSLPRKQTQPNQAKKRQGEKTVRSSGENDSPVKFPSLTDSVKTTQLRMLSNQKSISNTNSSEKSGTETMLLSSSLTRRDLKKNNNHVSGIPVPTFGTNSRKLAATFPGRRLDKKETKEKPTKLSKSKEELPMSKIPHKTIKIRMFNVGNNENVNGIRIKNDNEKKKETETEESIKFSESMLASIRENEFSTSDLFDGAEDKEERLKTCIFCHSSEQWSDEDSLNQHYLKECLMLTTCEYCMEVTEIPSYTNHLLDDCKWKTIFQKCIYCQEAILRDLYNKHECTASERKMHKPRCPFCHKEIGQGETDWKKHLMGKNTCPHHPRQRQSGL